MKKKLISFVFLIQTSLCLFSQTGSAVDPFPTLGHAMTATSAGKYYFDIGGVMFDTYVDANGYILTAIDFGNGTGNLPQVKSLDITARGILDASTLAAITTHTEIRITASSGNIDAIATNATLLNRITSNTTLHSGIADNAINNGWTGTGSANLNNNAVNTSPTANTLHRKIYHPSGNTNAFHWQPRINQQRELHSSGEIPNAESFRLWVRDNSFPLPIELMNFDAKLLQNKVNLSWETASEINNDYFTVESSTNGTEWEVVNNVTGAGNSTSVLTYSLIDESIHTGLSYYRLKQTDFNGDFSYSDVRTINAETQTVEIYPNPAKNYINIVSDDGKINLDDIQVYNIEGKKITQLVNIETKGMNALSIDLSELTPGLYFIRCNNESHKIYKE